MSRNPVERDMPIAFSCRQCSRNLRVKDELAGTQIYCPDCKSILQVPNSGDSDSQGAATASDDPYREEVANQAVREPRERSAVDAELPPPKKATPEKGGFGTINGGAGGGILMMVIAVVWFVVGWWAGRIFIYPPILFIIGLVSFIRALVTRD
jgi:hypothetical protein